MEQIKGYDPQKTAREVLAALRNNNTPLIMVEIVFDWTRKLIQQETCLTNNQGSSKQP